MKFQITGNLRASICETHKHPITFTKVRLYRLDGSQNENIALVSARDKEVIQIATEKQLQGLKKQLLSETTTDARGAYKFLLDEKNDNYDGSAVALVLIYDDIPNYGQENTQPLRGFTPFGVVLDVIQPKWRETENGLVATYNYLMYSRIWCRILELLDIWFICGILRNCESQTPITGIEVTAMDDDFITDDRLGSAVTDGNGRFCIYYRSIDFKKTFLSPFINLETLGASGPDVYFKFAVGGTEFDAEPPSAGQQPGRKNVGNCLCVDICLKDAPETEVDAPAAFYEIGYNRRYHPVLNINPITGLTTGKVEATFNDMAFYSNIQLRGSLNPELGGQPMEFKFQYAVVSNPSVDLATIINWKDVTPAQIANTIVGTRITQLFPIIERETYAIHPNVDQLDVPFNGNWIVAPQGPSAGFPITFDGALIKLKTASLIIDDSVTPQVLSARTVDKVGLVPGNSSAPLLNNDYVALRMIKRVVNDTSTEVEAGFSRPIAIFNTTYQNVKQGGSWLPTTSNELGIATIDIEELIGNGCGKLVDSLTVNYTAANPNLGAVSLLMFGQGGPHSFVPANNVPHTVVGEEARGSAVYDGNFEALPKCSYEVRLLAQLLLTDGEHQINRREDRVLFSK